MGYPILEIDLKKLVHNAKTEAEDLRRQGIELMGVNKVFSGALETAMAMVRGGITTIAEVTVSNLIKIKDVPCEKKVFLRNPGMSEIPDVVAYADVSLVSEIAAIEALSREAVRQNKLHKILLMVDMGDIREGLWFEDREGIEAALGKILEFPNLKLYGLGTNFGCYGTVMPTVENNRAFVNLARQLEEKFGIRFEYLSGGNCTSYPLVAKGLLPEGINQLRIGAQYIFGIEYVEGQYLEGYYHSSKDISKYASDAYILKSEIIEMRPKPTVPVGELGLIPL